LFEYNLNADPLDLFGMNWIPPILTSVFNSSRIRCDK